jgi:hypothetical protein
MAKSHVLIAIATRVVTVETIASERAGRIAVVYYSARGAADSATQHRGWQQDKR